VGTGALIVERKFIHELGLVGHIEDIAVAKDQQGKKLGLRIIQALDFVAEKVGCYKVCFMFSEILWSGGLVEWKGVGCAVPFFPRCG
jgi:glucosamine-phosphate N-acetyltransferase